MSIESYRKGYEDGKSDGLAMKALRPTLSITQDDDYNDGYEDAAAGRPFNYYGDTGDGDD